MECILYGNVYVFVGDFLVDFCFNFDMQQKYVVYDDMGNLNRVVYDLLFYVYYMNLDCLWDFWIK